MLAQVVKCPDSVKAVFSTMLTVISTCKHQLQALSNYQNQQQGFTPAEELERQRSLVLIGVPEINGTNHKPSDQVKADFCTAQGILDQLGVEAQPVSVYRLGKKDIPTRTGPRLVKIFLPARFFQNQALGQWKRCRDDIKAKPEFARLIIRPSLTRAQQEEEWKQRNERRMQTRGQGHGQPPATPRTNTDECQPPTSPRTSMEECQPPAHNHQELMAMSQTTHAEDPWTRFKILAQRNQARRQE
jgi:hypothetical protein